MTQPNIALRVSTVVFVGLLAAGHVTPQIVGPTPDQQKSEHDYADMLARVQQGDVTVDFRAFRVAGALVAAARPPVGFGDPAGSASARELYYHRTFTDLLSKGDFNSALDNANRALEHNYASLIGHLDALVACESLHKTDEAALHEKVLNASLDSIRVSGDGKTPETAWFVVTIPEEYVVISRILGDAPKQQLTDRWDSPLPANQGRVFVTRNGHAYERVEVVDSKTNQSEYVWFNIDIDSGASPSKMELTPDPVTLLTGRLTLRVPREAKIQARRAGIMSAAESTDDESRVVFDYGPEKMVLIVSETFSRSAPTSFEAVVRRKVGSTSKTIENLDLRGVLHAVAYWPKEDSWKAEANLIMGVFTMRPDGTVQNLAFYINPAASQDVDAWERLAWSIAATVSEGQGTLPSERGDRQFGGLVAPVPDGYVLTTQRGPDFAVYHLRKLTKFGEPAASLNVYRGIHPQGFSNGPQVKTSSAVLLGVPTQWRETVRTESAETVITTEALVMVRQNPPAYAHIFLSCGTSEQADELKRIAESMKIAATTSATNNSSAASLIPGAVSQIRVRNNSGTDFRNVKVGGHDYGNVRAGAATSYESWNGAYGYEPVSLMTAAGAMNIPAPSDHVGDPKLGEGQFTFVLSIRDDRLVSGLERDNRSSSPDHVESGIFPHTFHLNQRNLASGGVGYGLDGTYLLRPHEVVVRTSGGPLLAHRPVVLHSLRIGICGTTEDGYVDNIFSPEIKLNEKRLAAREGYRLPAETIRIEVTRALPEQNWLCSVLLESGGSDVAEIPGHPILVPSVAAHQGAANTQTQVTGSVAWNGTVKSGTCGGKEATASIPEASLIALTKAQLADDFDEISRISEEAGLQVMVLRKAGHVVSYIIENQNDQCVAMRGEWRR
jgi:hypothetical protein